MAEVQNKLDSKLSSSRNKRNQGSNMTRCCLASFQKTRAMFNFPTEMSLTLSRTPSKKSSVRSILVCPDYTPRACTCSPCCEHSRYASCVMSQPVFSNFFSFISLLSIMAVPGGQHSFRYTHYRALGDSAVWKWQRASLERKYILCKSPKYMLEANFEG